MMNRTPQNRYTSNIISTTYTYIVHSYARLFFLSIFFSQFVRSSYCVSDACLPSNFWIISTWNVLHANSRSLNLNWKLKFENWKSLSYLSTHECWSRQKCFGAFAQIAIFVESVGMCIISAVKPHLSIFNDESHTYAHTNDLFLSVSRGANRIGRPTRIHSPFISTSTRASQSKII